MPYMAEAEYHNIVCLSFKSLLCLSSIMLFVQSALLLWKPFRYISDNAIEKKETLITTHCFGQNITN